VRRPILTRRCADHLPTHSFFARIDEAYERANSALLRLLLVDHSIMERLRSMRHYFFQAQGDFFSIFLVNAEHELRKRVNPSHIREATTARLQSILGMVLGSSSCVGSDDPYREDVRIDFAGENAYEQMRRIAETKGGVEAAKAQARRERQRDVDLISGAWPRSECREAKLTPRHSHGAAAV